MSIGFEVELHSVAPIMLPTEKGTMPRKWMALCKTNGNWKWVNLKTVNGNAYQEVPMVIHMKSPDMKINITFDHKNFYKNHVMMGLGTDSDSGLGSHLGIKPDKVIAAKSGGPVHVPIIEVTTSPVDLQSKSDCNRMLSWLKWVVKYLQEKTYEVYRSKKRDAFFTLQDVAQEMIRQDRGRNLGQIEFAKATGLNSGEEYDYGTLAFGLRGAIAESETHRNHVAVQATVGIDVTRMHLLLWLLCSRDWAMGYNSAGWTFYTKMALERNGYIKKATMFSRTDPHQLPVRISAAQGMKLLMDLYTLILADPLNKRPKETEEKTVKKNWVPILFKTELWQMFHICLNDDEKQEAGQLLDKLKKDMADSDNWGKKKEWKKAWDWKPPSSKKSKATGEKLYAAALKGEEINFVGILDTYNPISVELVGKTSGPFISKKHGAKYAVYWTERKAKAGKSSYKKYFPEKWDKKKDKKGKSLQRPEDTWKDGGKVGMMGGVGEIRDMRKDTREHWFGSSTQDSQGWLGDFLIDLRHLNSGAWRLKRQGTRQASFKWVPVPPDKPKRSELSSKVKWHLIKPRVKSAPQRPNRKG